MWYGKRYDYIQKGNHSHVKDGYVQDLPGSARYEGSEPSYDVRDFRSKGNAPDYWGNPGSGVYSAQLYGQFCEPPSRLQQSLYNRAYARMREKVQDGSTFGTTIAEGRESFELIASRGGSLLKAFRKIRKGDPKGFLYELSVPQHHRRKEGFSTKHWLSGHWLEYWLGIAPTISDIEKSIQVLGRDHLSGKRCKVASFEKYQYRAGSLATTVWPPYHRAECTAMEGIYVQVRVDNPNTYLAAQLGLLNPVAIAWELVPLSFVANWFYDVGSFLNAFDTFYGLEIQDGGVFHKYEYKGIEIADTSGQRVVADYSGYRFRRERSLSFPLPRPVLELPRLSWTRAATSISLLTQLFLK